MTPNGSSPLESDDERACAGGSGVRLTRDRALGIMVLDRDATLNALTLPMIRAMSATLDAWRDDPGVRTVMVEGDGRAFCAGGDIRAVFESVENGSDGAAELWREQYLLNAKIVRYPKPIFTLLDGITMGGGVGLGCHAQHRIVTENSLIAMPEVSIGLAPDVGGLLLLARAPGEVGTHLALTAGKVGARDAIWCGLADHFLQTSRVDEVREMLADASDADAIAVLTSDPTAGEPPSGLVEDQSWIDECYGGDDPVEILQRLRAHEHSRAREAAATLAAMSPLAVTVALRALRSAAALDDELAVFVQDYRVTMRFLSTPDLAAGIRSAIITKDLNPTWAPAGLEEVTVQMVDRHFETLGERELLAEVERAR